MDAENNEVVYDEMLNIKYTAWLQNAEIVKPKYCSHGARAPAAPLSSINIIIY